MLIIIISLKLGHVGSKTRSLGQQATQVSDLGPLWPSCSNRTLNIVRVKSILKSWIHKKVWNIGEMSEKKEEKSGKFEAEVEWQP